MGEGDEADKEDIDQVLATVDLPGDPAEVRERLQAQWPEARRKTDSNQQVRLHSRGPGRKLMPECRRDPWVG